MTTQEQEATCERCEDGTHNDEDLITVEGKHFCPTTRRRVMPAEDWEEATDEETAEIKGERVRLVVAPVWEIFRVEVQATKNLERWGSK